MNWGLFYKPGGLDLSRHCQDVSVDDRENLDSFKKLVSTIDREISIQVEKSWFCLDITIQIQISWSRLRFIETDQDLPKISIISQSRSRSSYNFHKSWSWLLLLIHFTNRQLSISKNLSKMLRNLKKSQKVSTKILIISKNHGNLDLSRWSRLVSTISIKVSTQPSLNCKSLNFKNLDREKKWWFSKVSLDTKDIRDLDLDWSRLSRPPGLLFYKVAEIVKENR